jgi:hypothetical protein
VGHRAVRRRLGKPGRRWWHVQRLILLAADAWDGWTGDLALSGVDPRGWDLNLLLAAFEASLRRSAKDEAEHRRLQAQLTAEPREVREERRRAAAAGRAVPSGSGMSVECAEAMLARFAAADASFGQ